MPASHSRFDWTDATISRLCVLWSEGHATAEIGRRLGISKNAVIGKAARIGLPPRPSPIRLRSADAPPHPRRRAAVPKLVDIMPLSPTVLANTAEPAVVPLRAEPMAMPTERSGVGQPQAYRGRITPCCWPMGEPGRPGFRFCDVPSAPGKPYCEDHSRKAYIPTRAPDGDEGENQRRAVRRPA